jgi:hypothetical protein
MGQDMARYCAEESERETREELGRLREVARLAAEYLRTTSTPQRTNDPIWSARAALEGSLERAGYVARDADAVSGGGS